MNLYFFLKTKGGYFCWILIVTAFIFFDNYFWDIYLGMIAGFLFIFIKDILPRRYGIRYFDTPQILKKCI